MPTHGRTDTAKWRQAKRKALRRANGVCQLCFKPLDPLAPRATPWATEIDHIIPLADGGDPYADDNLRALHRKCHQQRSILEPQRDDFESKRVVATLSPSGIPQSNAWPW